MPNLPLLSAIIVFPQEPLDHLQLPLLVHHPFIIFMQESLEVFNYLVRQ